MNIRIVLEPSEEGGYTVYVPSLPGCISEGDTREEAIENIKEAIDLFLEPIEDEVILGEKAEQIESSASTSKRRFCYSQNKGKSYPSS